MKENIRYARSLNFLHLSSHMLYLIIGLFLLNKIFENLPFFKSCKCFDNFIFLRGERNIPLSFSLLHKEYADEVVGQEKAAACSAAKLLRLSTRLSKAPTNTSQACNSCDEAARSRRHSATKIPRFNRRDERNAPLILLRPPSHNFLYLLEVSLRLQLFDPRLL